MSEPIVSDAAHGEQDTPGFGPPDGPPIDPTWGRPSWATTQEFADDTPELGPSSYMRPDDPTLVPIPTVRQHPPRGGYRDFRRAPTNHKKQGVLLAVAALAGVTLTVAVMLIAANL